VNILT